MTTEKAEHLLKGSDAERLAAKTVKAAGLKILTQNYQSRFGEIDLICTEADTLVFIEVRYRSNNRFGSAAASVTLSKQKKITKTAQLYLLGKPKLSKLFMRFDVIGIDADHRIDWIKGAFPAAV